MTTVPAPRTPLDPQPREERTSRTDALPREERMARTDAPSRLVGVYMLFYATGSGLGALAATATYASFGWSGVCLLGAGVSLAALVFWAATLQFMPDAASSASPSARLGA